MKGQAIPLSQVKDEVFSSKAMGDGIGIIPSEGKVYAPFDGTAEAVFPTGHAVGITGENGLEMLIHVGIDTVELKGKGFKAHVNAGDTVKKGQLLVEFDKELIAKEGYDTTVIYIITNMDAVKNLEIHTGNKEVSEKVMTADC